jgi:inner membrane protein
MPSPVGHALAGLSVHVLLARDEAELWSAPRAATIVLAALAPDLDLLLKLTDGLNHHQAEVHSVGFALIVGLAAFGVFRARRLPRAGAVGVAACLAWGSHLLLDYLSRDTSPPIGLMALWPFSATYYKFPWPIFLDIYRSLAPSALAHDALAAAWEVALLLPLLWLAHRWRRRRLGL